MSIQAISKTSGNYANVLVWVTNESQNSGKVATLSYEGGVYIGRLLELKTAAALDYDYLSTDEYEVELYFSQHVYAEPTSLKLFVGYDSPIEAIQFSSLEALCEAGVKLAQLCQEAIDHNKGGTVLNALESAVKIYHAP